MLQFRHERDRWIHWLGETLRRYRLSVLDYCVTGNHIHVCVYDHGKGEIVRSMQLVQSRVAQEYNVRKGRHGVFWEGRYHATAVETGVHALRCCSYIDLNMVRAGVVAHPADWPWCGYTEITAGRERYRLIDRPRLAEVLAVESVEELSAIYRDRVAYLLDREQRTRESKWTEAVAVGDESFVSGVMDKLKDIRSVWHSIANDNQDGSVVLRETRGSYSSDSTVQIGPLSVDFGPKQRVNRSM